LKLRLTDARVIFESELLGFLQRQLHLRVRGDAAKEQKCQPFHASTRLR
jgi:hypothetical protein